MKRAAMEKTRTKNVWRQHYNEHVRSDVRSGGKRGVQCVCDLQVNRFRKGQKAFGCGRPQCYACHGDKLLGNLKHRDQLALVREKEGITEL